MNFLGHIYLSGQSPELLVGNLITDMLRLKELQSLTGEYRSGMLLHQRIDQLTDSDKRVSQINKMLSPVQGKYAPVVSDILFDFLICHNWYRLTDNSFDEFCQTSYNYILAANASLPIRIRSRLESMVHNRWLHQQASWEGLNHTLLRMDQRTRFPSKFRQAGTQLLGEFETFNLLFMEFFGSIEINIRQWKSNRDSPILQN